MEIAPNLLEVVNFEANEMEYIVDVLEQGFDIAKWIIAGFFVSLLLLATVGCLVVYWTRRCKLRQVRILQDQEDLDLEKRSFRLKTIPESKFDLHFKVITDFTPCNQGHD